MGVSDDVPAVHRPVVVGLGRVTAALTGLTNTLQKNSDVIEISDVSMQVGGSIPVALGAARALGCSCRLASRVADDELGQYVMEELDKAGVDTTHVEVVAGAETAMSFTVRADRAANVRRRYASAGTAPAVEVQGLDVESLLAEAGALLIDGTYPDAQEALAGMARARGIPVIFDGTALADGVRDLIKYSDVLVASERLATELAQRAELDDSLDVLTAMGPGVVIITLGAAGCIGRHGSRVVEVPAFRVDAVDTYGAGYVFLGVFSAALLGGLPLLRCMELANAAAALSCTVPGPWAGIPERNALIDFIRQHRR